jgi:hypothetical protein
MTIPPGDDFRRLGNQRFADEFETLDSPSTDLAAPPAHWVAPDGEPISSHPSHLLAREAQPYLVSSGWNELDAQAFISHLDRTALHASRDRNFKHAWIKDPDTGQTRPKYYRTNSAQLTRCQYAVLTHPQRTTVLVIDIDTPSGQTGGQIDALHPEALTKLNTLCAQSFGPAWIGINPINGKAQALWMIDPVYASPGSTSPNTRLLTVATAELNRYLGGDGAFAHHFSRWPLHQSDDPMAYRWHCQHHNIVRLGTLTQVVRDMNPPQPQKRPGASQQFASGRERILAARRAAQQALTLKALNEELASVEELAPASAGVIDGVRVIWITQGQRAARDETAFRHALATGHRLKAQGEPLKDNKLIDAYERAYNIAQAVGADNRQPNIPPMRDRLTMARRVRAYVTQGITNPNQTNRSMRQSSAGRKALATMGRRGGKQAAKRWKDPAHKDYQEAARKPLDAANRRRKAQGSGSRARILSLVSQQYAETGTIPTRPELMKETGLSRATVTRHLSALRKADLLPDR